MFEVIVGNRGQMCPSVFSALTRYRCHPPGGLEELSRFPVGARCPVA